MSPEEMLDRIQRACVILGVDPPTELFRKTTLTVQRFVDAERGGHYWDVTWIGPPKGASAVISESAAPESVPAASQ